MSKKSTLMIVGITIAVVMLFVATILLPSFKGNSGNEEVYATDINVICARSIDLFIENSIYFSDLPVSLSPAKCNQEVSVSILDSSGSKQDNCEFKDNCFSASESGSYYLTFSVLNNYNQTITDRIKIKVYDKIEDSTDCITLKSSSASIYNNESLNLDNFVEIKTSNSANIEYFSDNNPLYTNEFSSTNIGNFEIKIFINNLGFSIVETFNIEVKERNINYIKLLDKDNNEIKNLETVNVSLSDETAYFYFEIGTNGLAITCSEFDKNIISILSKEPPFLVVQLLKTGKTCLKISTSTAEEIKIYINVI